MRYFPIFNDVLEKTSMFLTMFEKTQNIMLTISDVFQTIEKKYRQILQVLQLQTIERNFKTWIVYFRFTSQSYSELHFLLNNKTFVIVLYVVLKT